MRKIFRYDCSHCYCYFAGIEDGYAGADYINTQGFESSSESRAQADIKFTYVVSCQIYGQQKQKKDKEAADIALLMQRSRVPGLIFSCFLEC